MFETIVRLYKKIGNAEVVEKAATKGWISQEEKTNILAG
nr:XkdX family protein [Blautia pseudococcoides]